MVDFLLHYFPYQLPWSQLFTAIKWTLLFLYLTGNMADSYRRVLPKLPCDTVCAKNLDNRLSKANKPSDGVRCDVRNLGKLLTDFWCSPLIPPLQTTESLSKHWWTTTCHPNTHNSATHQWCILLCLINLMSAMTWERPSITELPITNQCCFIMMKANQYWRYHQNLLLVSSLTNHASGQRTGKAFLSRDRAK